MFVIESQVELLALNKALMEVRFLGEGIDDATRGSSLLAGLHTRLIHELIACHQDQGEIAKAEAWREWRTFGGRSLERPRIIEYLSQSWHSLESDALKRQVLANQLLPFVYTENEAEDIYRELDKIVLLGKQPEE